MTRTDRPRTSTIKPGAILRELESNVGRDAAFPSLTEERAPAQRRTQEEEPVLEIERADGRVRRIVAICGCGRKIEIHCDYDAPDGG